jgi:hypothetical protein
MALRQPFRLVLACTAPSHVSTPHRPLASDFNVRLLIMVPRLGHTYNKVHILVVLRKMEDDVCHLMLSIYQAPLPGGAFPKLKGAIIGKPSSGVS